MDQQMMAMFQKQLEAAEKRADQAEKRYEQQRKDDEKKFEHAEKVRREEKLDAEKLRKEEKLEAEQIRKDTVKYHEEMLASVLGQIKHKPNACAAAANTGSVTGEGVWSTLTIFDAYSTRCQLRSG